MYINVQYGRNNSLGYPHPSEKMKRIHQQTCFVVFYAGDAEVTADKLHNWPGGSWSGVRWSHEQAGVEFRVRGQEEGKVGTIAE